MNEIELPEEPVKMRPEYVGNWRSKRWFAGNDSGVSIEPWESVDGRSIDVHADGSTTWNNFPTLDLSHQYFPPQEPHSTWAVKRIAGNVWEKLSVTKTDTVVAVSAFSSYLRRKMHTFLVGECQCPAKVATEIVNGTTFTAEADTFEMPFVYICGPMRNVPEDNFPAFDEAKKLMLAKGFNVISPADIDRASGDKQSQDQLTFFLRDMFSLAFLKKAQQSQLRNGVMLLNGWSFSVGGAAEFHSARWLELQIYDFKGNEKPINEALKIYAINTANNQS